LPLLSAATMDRPKLLVLETRVDQAPTVRCPDGRSLFPPKCEPCGRSPLHVEHPEVGAAFGVVDAVGDARPVRRQSSRAPLLSGRPGQGLCDALASRSTQASSPAPHHRRPRRPRTPRRRRCNHLCRRARRRDAFDDRHFAAGHRQARELERHREECGTAHVRQVAGRHVVTIVSLFVRIRCRACRDRLPANCDPGAALTMR